MTFHTPARRSYVALAWATLILLFVFVASMRPAQAQAQKIIDINAVLQVTVAGEPDVSGQCTVDPNGNISMLYVNQVHVAGMTTAQAAAKLRKALLKFYVNPQVVVTILQPGGITVTMTGEVTNQKNFTVRSDAHLSEVISAAIPLADADLSQVKITHGGPDVTNKITQTVNYLDFRDNGNASGNPVLHDGDVVYVPSKTPVPIQVNFSGNFAKLGPVSLPAGTTFYDAITLDGGLTPTIDPKNITLRRAGSDQTIKLNYYDARDHAADPAYNPVLHDGDALQSVSLSGATTNTYNLTGAVEHPGPFPLTAPYTTLTDAIGLASGLAPNARLKEVTIVRPNPNGGQAQILHLDAQSAQVQSSTRIYPGDSVYIPQGRPGFAPDPLAILGAVGSLAGLYYLFHR